MISLAGVGINQRQDAHRTESMTTNNRLRRTWSAVLAAVLMVLSAGCTSGPEAQAPSSRLLTDMPLRADAHDVLIAGEVCTYGVSWAGILPVGRIEYSYDEIETDEGKLLVFEGLTEPVLAVEAFLKSSGTIRTLADPETFLPVSSFWVTAASDPHTRTTSFDQEAGVAIAGKWTSDFIQITEVRAERMLDPLSSIFYGRLVRLEPDSEIRVVMVEGTDVHLMTVRHAGEEHIVFEGESVPCTKVSLRTDRIGEDGELIDEEPWNDLIAWVAETPGRPIMRISGSVRFGSLVMKLASRTLPGQ